MANRTPSNAKVWYSMAVAVSIIGMICSIYFLLRAGYNQKSLLLIGLFIGWVLSPYAGFFALEKISRKRNTNPPLLIYLLPIAIAVVSPVLYSGAIQVPNTKPAFIFLVSPLLSWILVLLAFFVVRRKYKA